MTEPTPQLIGAVLKPPGLPFAIAPPCVGTSGQNREASPAQSHGEPALPAGLHAQWIPFPGSLSRARRSPLGLPPCISASVLTRIAPHTFAVTSHWGLPPEMSLPELPLMVWYVCVRLRPHHGLRCQAPRAGSGSLPNVFRQHGERHPPMKPATRQMIELALAGDETVEPAMRDCVSAALTGNLPAPGTRDDAPLLLTMTDAAKVLGVSRVTLWRVVREGVLRPVEIMPGIYRIRREDPVRLSADHTKYRPDQRGRTATRRHAGPRAPRQ